MLVSFHHFSIRRWFVPNSVSLLAKVVILRLKSQPADISGPLGDLAVDKIWDFAVGRCPALDPKDESWQWILVELKYWNSTIFEMPFNGVLFHALYNHVLSYGGGNLHLEPVTPCAFLERIMMLVVTQDHKRFQAVVLEISCSPSHAANFAHPCLKVFFTSFKESPISFRILRRWKRRTLKLWKSAAHLSFSLMLLIFLMSAKEKIQPPFLLLNFLRFQKFTKLNDFKRCKK